jgi:calcineurin-like phosphoesterase family protein
MASGVWFTSDSHYGHKGILKPTMHCRRCDHFSSVEEMDARMIDSWNAVVGPRDEVWHLGDFAYNCSLAHAESIFKRLRGRKHLIWGNHEQRGKRLAWESQQAYKELTVNGYDLVLFHYGLRTWNRMRHGAIHLFGHSHGALPGCSQSIDVGVDVWDFRPVSLDEILEKIKDLPPAYPETGQREAADHEDEDTEACCV